MSSIEFGGDPTSAAELKTRETTIVPEGTPLHLRDGVRRVAISSLNVQSSLHEVIESPWKNIKKEDCERFNIALWESSLLPADAPLLERTYTALTATLVDKEAPLMVKYAALVVGDALMHQTSLPSEEKKFLKKVVTIEKGRKSKKLGLMKEVSTFLESQPPTESSEKAFTGMMTASESFIETLEASVSKSPNTKGAHLGRLRSFTAVSDFRESQLYDFIKISMSPDLQTKLEEFYYQEALLLFMRGHATSLFLEGQVEASVPKLTHIIWSNSMRASRLRERKSERDSSLEKVGTYFLTSPRLQEDYWQSFPRVVASSVSIDTVAIDASRAKEMTVVPFLYPDTEWFFLQNEQILETFFQTRPQLDMGPKESYEQFKTLLSLVATFQTLNPDHPNIPVLHSEIKKVAAEQKVAKRVSAALDIVTDTVPGVITLDNYGIAATRLMKDQTLDDIVPPDASLLYRSKAEYPEVKAENPKPAVSIPVEVAEHEDILVIASGKEIELPHWQKGQSPREKDVPQIITHLANRLRRRAPDEDALLTLATQEINTKPSHKRVALLPLLLEDNHELSVLGKLGIVGVQREEDNLSFILDARRSGIATEGSPFVVFSGEKDAANDVQISGAPEDFEGSVLQLGLTAAARVTYGEPLSDEKVGKKVADRVAQIPRAVQEWNRDMRTERYPQITKEAPQPDETGLVYPVSKTDIVLLTMQDALTK